MQMYLNKGNQIHECRPLQIRGERMSGEIIIYYELFGLRVLYCIKFISSISHLFQKCTLYQK